MIERLFIGDHYVSSIKDLKDNIIQEDQTPNDKVSHQLIAAARDGSLTKWLELFGSTGKEYSTALKNIDKLANDVERYNSIRITFRPDLKPVYYSVKGKVEVKPLLDDLSISKYLNGEPVTITFQVRCHERFDNTIKAEFGGETKYIDQKKEGLQLLSFSFKKHPKRKDGGHLQLKVDGAPIWGKNLKGEKKSTFRYFDKFNFSINDTLFEMVNMGKDDDGYYTYLGKTLVTSSQWRAIMDEEDERVVIDNDKLYIISEQYNPEHVLNDFVSKMRNKLKRDHKDIEKIVDNVSYADKDRLLDDIRNNRGKLVLNGNEYCKEGSKLLVFNENGFHYYGNGNQIRVSEDYAHIENIGFRLSLYIKGK